MASVVIRSAFRPAVQAAFRRTGGAAFGQQARLMSTQYFTPGKLPAVSYVHVLVLCFLLVVQVLKEHDQIWIIFLLVVGEFCDDAGLCFSGVITTTEKVSSGRLPQSVKAWFGLGSIGLFIMTFSCVLIDKTLPMVHRSYKGIGHLPCPLLYPDTLRILFQLLLYP